MSERSCRIQTVNFPSHVFTAHDHIYSYFFTFAIILLKYCHPWRRLYKFFNEHNLQNITPLKHFMSNYLYYFGHLKCLEKSVGDFLSIVTTKFFRINKKNQNLILQL